MSIPACTDILTSSIRYGPGALDIIHACDKWAALHAVAPFLTAMFTGVWWMAPIIAMVGEVVEYVAYWALGSFAIFVATGDSSVDPNQDVESHAASYVDDIFIQGIIVAGILAWVFLQVVEAPSLLNGRDFWKRPYRFWYYLIAVIGLMIVLPAALYDLKAGSYQYGITVAIGIYILMALLIAWTGPDSAWYEEEINRTSIRGAKWIFFLAWFVPVLTLTVQNQFDYFFGGAPQSWLWAGILSLVGLVWGAVRWRPWRRIYFDYTFEN